MGPKTFRIFQQLPIFMERVRNIYFISKAVQKNRSVKISKTIPYYFYNSVQQFLWANLVELPILLAYIFLALLPCIKRILVAFSYQLMRSLDATVARPNLEWFRTARYFLILPHWQITPQLYTKKFSKKWNKNYRPFRQVAATLDFQNRWLAAAARIKFGQYLNGYYTKKSPF